ncbi:hypothetical protein Tco_0745560, partial [Tanacetum coccineum]
VGALVYVIRYLLRACFGLLLISFEDTVCAFECHVLDDATIYDLPDDDALHALCCIRFFSYGKKDMSAGNYNFCLRRLDKIDAKMPWFRKTVLPLGIVTISGCLKSYELKILKIFAPSLTNNRRKVIIEISGDTGEKKVTEENRVLQAP